MGSAFAKPLTNIMFFQCFWGPGLPKTASKSPRRLPRGTQTTMIQKWTPKLLICGPILGLFFGVILGPELAPKGDQTWDHFWNLSVPHLRGPNDAVLRIKQEWWNCYGYWNYIRQKKGRDIPAYTNLAQTAMLHEQFQGRGNPRTSLRAVHEPEQGPAFRWSR